MIFLSAQPDEIYFIWQIQVQLYNFKRLGIEGSDVHILFGVKKNPSQHLINFISSNKYGNIFTYKDDRLDLKYPSTIRPHIIKKHYEKFNSLDNKPIFYHDSDIIFREIPRFDLMLNDSYWYVSDTRNYISAKNIKNTDENLFIKMCDIVGIEQSIVEQNDQNAGGAQYIIKKATAKFWNKVEQDAEQIYLLLKKEDKNSKLQPWCADMWSLLWNAWLSEAKVKIHNELNFCWPHQSLSHWNTTKIFHNAGIELSKLEKIFCKGAFKCSNPLLAVFYSTI